MSEDSFKLNYWLAPLSFFYGMGVSLRNALFNWNILPSEEFPVPVICVGNLAAGGTGKTPHTEYIIRLLKDRYKLAVVSRGYKRKTKGYVLADEKSTSLTIGDEPYQMRTKFPDVIFAVDSDRRRAIHHLLSLPDEQKPEVILLDDGYQHRYVTPSLSIVLTDYNRLYYRDRLLPVGLLREAKREIRRANAVVITKSTGDLKPIDRRIIEDDMNLTENTHICFTKTSYEEMVPVFPEALEGEAKTEIRQEDELLLLAGIAAPGPFIEKVNSLSEHALPMIFPDHHTFDKHDIRKIRQAFDKMESPGKYILMTEKDAARLAHNDLVPEEWKSLMYYLPICIDFCQEEKEDFDHFVIGHIVSFKNNYIY